MELWCAYVEEFGNIGILDMSGIGSSAIASGTDSSATDSGVIGTSVGVEGPSYWGSRDALGGQRPKYVCSFAPRRESWRSCHGQGELDDVQLP